jgi:hypothetical protein
MSSITKIVDDDSNEEIDSFSEVSDIALMYGLGIGIEWNYSDYYAIYARVDYALGNSVDYLAFDADIEKDQVTYPVELYNKVESSADMLIFGLGFIGRL